MNNAWIVAIVSGLIVAFILFVISHALRVKSSERTEFQPRYSAQGIIDKYVKPPLAVLAFLAFFWVVAVVSNDMTAREQMPQEWRQLFNVLQRVTMADRESTFNYYITTHRMPEMGPAAKDKFLELFPGNEQVAVLIAIEETEKQIGPEDGQQ